MKSRTLSKPAAIFLSCLTVSMALVQPLLSDACAAGHDKNSKSFASVTATATPLTTLATDVVLEWNQQAVALSLLPASQLSPIQQTRVMAIFQVSVHDAVNGITGEYETYLSEPGPENASPEAAAIAAAHHSLKNLFPGNDMQLDTLYQNSLTAHGLSTTDPGIEFGESASSAILAMRSDDHSSQAKYDYDAPGAGDPGVWVRLNGAAALLPGWGEVTPFVLRSSRQFQPEPPPPLQSEKYVRDYNEIKSIGASGSSTRTAEQSQIALFWRASPTAIWNSVLTQVVPTRELDLSDKAQLFALFYLASADASIGCWKAKYEHNFWRPQLAIRNGDADLNDRTVGDSGWLPFIATPPHPEYPSGHTTNSSAMAKVLTSVFDDNPGIQIVVTQSGITRRWNSFSEAVAEVIDARVYSGIHFRNSDEVGARMGSEIAQYVLHHALRKTNQR